MQSAITTDLSQRVTCNTGKTTSPCETNYLWEIVHQIGIETRNGFKQGLSKASKLYRFIMKKLDEGAEIHNRQKLMAENFYQSNAFYLRTVI